MASTERAASHERLQNLAPVIAASQQVVPPPIPAINSLFSTIVEAAFDLLDELGELSLAVYLHAPHDDQPQFFIRRPDLGLRSPTETFRLMHTVTMLSNGRKPVAAFRHGDLDGHYVRTTGAHSDGLFVFGGIQRTEVARRITSVARAFSHVLHQFHLDDDPDVVHEAPLISVEAVDTAMRVEATIVTDGVEFVGSSTAANPDEAVARAVIDAIAPDYEFDEIRTLELDNRSAVLAVLRDERRMLRLGLAISSGDLIRTAALATRRAILNKTD
jgi:hypothetical protein